MAATVAGWLLLFTAGALVQVLVPGPRPVPGDDETSWDFQFGVSGMLLLPLALAPLTLAQAIDYWTLGPKAHAATLARG